MFIYYYFSSKGTENIAENYLQQQQILTLSIEEKFKNVQKKKYLN